MFYELESRLYRSRDAFASALPEYDEVIRRHDAEMDVIRAALIAELGQIPVLETYKQASIRHQKAKDIPVLGGGCSEDSRSMGLTVAGRKQ